MKAMKVYFENYDNAVVHIQKLKSTSPEFARFVTAAEKHPNCAKLDLLSLLITPIQRMPRYDLVLFLFYMFFIFASSSILKCIYFFAGMKCCYLH